MRKITGYAILVLLACGIFMLLAFTFSFIEAMKGLLYVAGVSAVLIIADQLIEYKPKGK